MQARQLIAVFGLLLLILTAATGTFAASTLVVTKTADTADGVCDSDCSLREAVVAAIAGDTIAFSSLFYLPQTITLTSGQIAITKDLTITGPGQGLLSINGNNADRIFNISGASTIVMSRMRLRNGRSGFVASDRHGGAINIVSSNLSLQDMEFDHNVAMNSQFDAEGGAIYANQNSTVNVNGVSFHDNSATFDAVHGNLSVINIFNSAFVNNAGGGVSARTVTMDNSTVSGNVGIGVGARFLTILNSKIIGNRRGASGGDSNSQITIYHSVITDNSPDCGVVTIGISKISDTLIANNGYSGPGGGINNLGTLYVTNSSIINNKATESGGGIETAIGHLYLTNSTVSGNIAGSSGSAGMRGGGIHNDDFADGRMTITDSTISNNRSTGSGGGVSHESSNAARLGNTIVAGNTSISTPQMDGSGIFVSDGTNLVGTSAGSSGWIASDLLNQSSLLAPLGNNGHGAFTHALLPGSPAINAGNNALAVDPLTMLVLTVDQRGFERFIGGGTPGIVDIGAHEAFYSSTPVTVSGLVTKSTGRGLDRVRIKLDDGIGNVSYTQTNPFGYYRFVDLIPAKTYTITVSHKFFMFDSPQSFTADQNRDDLNFIARL